jgi:tRNA (guanine-N7-)-methyltransferase
MGKDKLRKFAENLTYSNFFQPSPEEMFQKDFFMKGKWNSDFFKNDNPIVIEVGCGKGEYTTGLAEKYPNKNFIGIDLKGARIWRGLKTSKEKSLTNVAFIRNKIEFINSFFTENEVSEIWVTFPDPQNKKARKRLTSPRFLNSYSNILKPVGTVNLKTDSKLLHFYTLAVIKENNLNKIFSSDDIYSLTERDEILDIKTFYEKKFLAQEIKITYIKFELRKNFDYKHVDNEIDFC